MSKKYLKMNIFLLITNLFCVFLNLSAGNYWVIPINIIAIVLVSIGLYLNLNQPIEVKPDEKPNWPPVEQK